MTPNSRSYLNHFTQPDSIVPDPYNPQDWDRFSYARNNPVRYVDPSGHIACDGSGLDGECDQSGIPGTLGQLRKELRSYGVALKGNWKFDDAYDAYLAVFAVGEAFGRVAQKNGKDVFRESFGSLNLYYGSAPGLEIGRYFGRTQCGPDVCNIAFQPGMITPRLIVHELGHAFEKHMWYQDGQKYSGTNNPLQLLTKGIYDADGNLITASQNRYNGLSAPDNGYYCDSYIGECQYHSKDVDDYWNDPSEDFADIFMNWTFNSFYPNGAGVGLYHWTETNMATWLQ